MFQRQYSMFDRFILFCEEVVHTSMGVSAATRTSPAASINESALTEEERKLSANLLRVDHAGEVCAQALYKGHACTARNSVVKQHMLNAAQEEADHLAWCAQRLHELDDHVSYLNPVWYMGSFTIGAVSGLLGDAWNLGFVAETEHQVEAHLKSHLALVPAQDHKSRHILLQMQADEMQHAHEALAAGGKSLPSFIKKSMKAVSKVMTTLAFYI